MRGDAFGVPGLHGREQRLVRARDLMRIVEIGRLVQNIELPPETLEQALAEENVM